MNFWNSFLIKASNPRLSVLIFLLFGKYIVGILNCSAISLKNRLWQASTSILSNQKAIYEYKNQCLMIWLCWDLRRTGLYSKERRFTMRWWSTSFFVFGKRITYSVSSGLQCSLFPLSNVWNTGKIRIRPFALLVWSGHGTMCSFSFICHDGKWKR